uniref:Response regulator n=1 Tax=Oscillatoriales cyanobacterium SpSt-402 TaxID=2282168 RepID=A0A832M288_9CYAN
MSDPLTVLMVEDSEDDALLVLRELRRGGFEVTWERVQTANALRTALVNRRWDVIISDYRLPGFDARAALALFSKVSWIYRLLWCRAPSAKLQPLP